MNTRPSLIQDRLPLEREARARKKDERLSVPQPLSDYRDVPAWVLLADPGAGKSDVFSSLSLSEGGTCVSARDFVELDLPTDWQEPLFIDGLDEITSGQAMGSTPLGQIRQKLQRLGTPKFRLSCREADWRGNADGDALKRLVGDGNFAELHLAPLSHAQSVALIAYWQSNTDEAQAEAFMQKAEQRDLGGLLDNPQTLRMLVTAHAANGGDWPASKTQTYEMACEQLVREHNDEHLANSRDSTPPDDQTLLAAGYLCAVMLLSGSGAIALQRQSQSRTGVVSLPELKSADSAPDLPTSRAALHTRLFRGNGTGDFWPVHRTVAEYLGAKYLASRIQAGLPASRVLALMLGEDAGIVPELRGLHAWLAVTAPGELRRELIERDPLGVVLNGDVRNFSRADKLNVLNALRDEATRYTYFRSQNWASHPFGALATKEMEGDFKGLLELTDRSPAHLALVDCVLDALAHGQHMPALAPELEQVVRDKTYWSGSRKEAITILGTYAQEESNWLTLTQLLADVHNNVVEDLEDELLGALLQKLYPGHISPAEVWQYFKQPKAEQLIGNYWLFWHDLSKETAPQEEVPTLLDTLFSTGFQLNNRPDRLDSSKIVGKLLARGVTGSGEQIAVPRLYSWLSLGLGPHQYCPLAQADKSALGQWLGEHPATYKALFEHGLSVQNQTSDSILRNLWQIRAHLYGASEPDDATPWYVSLAKASSNENLRRQLVTEAFRLTHQRKGPNSAIELLEKWSEDNASDADWVEGILRSPYPPQEIEQQHIDWEINYKKSEAEKSRQKIRCFSEALPSFATGPAHVSALIEVAESYLDFFRNSKETTPDARLQELLNQNQEWVFLALHGLRQCLFRKDLPSAADIIDLNIKGQRYNLATPCMAAMELRYTENPATALDLRSVVLETVAAFRLTNDYYETPIWFKQLLAQRPDVLVKVMHPLISQQISTKKEHVDGLQALAHDTTYSEVTRQITPALINEFPTKASKQQLPILRLLIVSMLHSVDYESQLSLIATKLSSPLMDVAQQVYWLTAGVQLAPNLYLEQTKQFVGKTQTRINHLIAMIHERQSRGSSPVNLPVATQDFFIALLGPCSNPSWANGGGWVTPEMELGRYVEGLISALVNNPDDAATKALIDLRQRHDLKHWADSLNRALYDQRITRRKARFKPAQVETVCATLANLKPANASDLWALTVYHLTQLVHAIQHSNTDQYDHYWSGDKPQSEEICRNLLLTYLQLILAPLDISVEPERRHPDKKRADIEVAAGLLHIPIEAKGEWNTDVWKAIENQLIAKYGRETASDGYGIYLVFWFTGNLKAAPTDGGAKVKSPQELQQRLTATIPEALKHKIAVLVVDCSKPKTV